MNGKENIINKILSDADARCCEILSAADVQAKAILDEANESVARDKATLKERISSVAGERMRNRKATAELDAKKYTLNVKQRLISRCYDEAYDRLIKMSEGDRLDLIGTLIDKYAERGETVYITQADAKGVTQLWLNGFDKELKLGKKYIKADGGIVLEGSGYEKDLTLRRVVEYAREMTEGRVAELLLGDHNA